MAHRPWGYLLAGAGLAMWVLESTSIAVDQWYGHAAVVYGGAGLIRDGFGMPDGWLACCWWWWWWPGSWCSC